MNGLYREPTTSDDAQDTIQQIGETYKNAHSGEHFRSSLMTDFDQKKTRHRLNSETSNYRTSYLPYITGIAAQDSQKTLRTIHEKTPNSSTSSSINFELEIDAKKDATSSDEENGKVSQSSSGIESGEDAFNNNVIVKPVLHQQNSRRSRFLSENTVASNYSPSLTVVAKTKVATPYGTRLKIRNIVMFLLVANACMWIFWSLEGTAFILYPWPSQYYEGKTWNTILSTCLPLAIFFRMHSSACLFEIWSFS